MARVKTALMLLPICSGLAASVQTARAKGIETYIAEAAARANIPPGWIAAVMRAESQGDASAVSPKGAMGLMQIMPDTWRELRAALNLGADPFDPRDNITAGAAYLRWLHDRYGDVGFLAAYNAGPGRYEELLRDGRALPDETWNYVARVVRLLRDESFDGAGFVIRPHAELSSGSRLFVGPFAARAATHDAPEVMPIFVHAMPPGASPARLFVPVSQRSAP